MVRKIILRKKFVAHQIDLYLSQIVLNVLITLRKEQTQKIKVLECLSESEAYRTNPLMFCTIWRLQQEGYAKDIAFGMVKKLTIKVLKKYPILTLKIGLRIKRNSSGIRKIPNLINSLYHHRIKT